MAWGIGVRGSTARQYSIGAIVLDDDVTAAAAAAAGRSTSLLAPAPVTCTHAASIYISIIIKIMKCIYLVRTSLSRSTANRYMARTVWIRKWKWNGTVTRNAGMYIWIHGLVSSWNQPVFCTMFSPPINKKRVQERSRKIVPYCHTLAATNMHKYTHSPGGAL